jgi:hypothetical protein
MRRDNLVASLSHATGASSMPIADVSAAKNRSTKNTVPNTSPPVTWPKAKGSVMKTRPGPPAGSRPYMKMIGKIARPASSATAVSAPTIMAADAGRFVLRSIYAP